MKIGIFGQFGTGNSGNDGSLEVMLSFLGKTFPEAKLLCICSGPAKIQREFGIETYPISHAAPRFWPIRWIDALLLQIPRRTADFVRAIFIVRSLDLLIIPGTGILDDFSETPFGWPYVILRWCLAARLGGAQLAFVSVGAGPIRHPLSRFFLKSAAWLGNYRSYRDKLSHDFMKTLQLDVSRDPVSADLAFSLPAATEPDRAENTPDSVGIGIMIYSGWEKGGSDGQVIYRNYMAKMAELIGWLHQQGLTVRLLIGDLYDRPTVAEMLQKLRSETLGDAVGDIIAEDMETLHDVMAQIAKTDIVVASRYHNVVCALRMGRPVISLSYAAKNDALLDDAGLSDYCHHIETFDVESVKLQIMEMLANRAELSKRVVEGVANFQTKLTEQEIQLRAMLSEAAEKNSGVRPVLDPL